MKTVDNKLILDKDNIDNICSEIIEFISINIEMQDNYKDIVNNYLSKITSYSAINKSTTITNFLDDLKSVLQLTKNNINKLDKLRLFIKSSVETDTIFNSIENIYFEYIKLQKYLLKQSIRLTSYLKYTSEYINSLCKNHEMESNATEETIEETSNISKEIIIPINQTSYLENTLIISEKDSKVILPFNINHLNDLMKTNNSKYSSYEEIIDDLYTLPYNLYKNGSSARFREIFNLVRNKEKKSFKEALDLAMEVMFNYNLHPAIISACQNIDQLDIYLSYLDTNETDKFSVFNIKYDTMNDN